jgi:hypothetical protein
MKKIIMSILLIGLLGGVSLWMYSQIGNSEIVTCDGEDIPCTFSEVSEETFEKSVETMLSAQDMADQGNDVSEIIAYIDEQEELIDLQVGPEAIVFQAVGGPMLVVEAESGDYNGETEIENIEITLKGKESMNVAYAQEANEVDVTAADEGKEQRETKQALVLSPYAWDFPNDDAPVVRDILESNRNYSGNVTYKSNSYDGQNNIGILDYVGWDQYEVVHLSTHGILACRPAKDGEIEIVSGGNSSLCKSLIDTGYKFKSEKDYEQAKAKWKGIPGVAMSKSTLYLSSTFFGISASSPLENTVVSFSACEMGIQTDMPNMISGNMVSGDFFYWTKTVNDSDAQAAFKKLYEDSVIKGMDVSTAYELMPGSLKNGLPSSIDVRFKDENGVISSSSIETTTDFKHISVKSPQHVIETITMIDPVDGKVVADGTQFEFIGETGDNTPDRMNIKFRLNGYTQDEVNTKGITLSFGLDGKKYIDKVNPISEAKSNPKVKIENGDHDKEFFVEVTDLEVRPIKDNDALFFEAYMDFDAGNFGYHSAQIVTNLPDVRAYTTDGKLEAIYDNDSDSLKITSQGETAYMDENYTYAFVPGEGWTGVDIGNITGGFGGAMQGLPSTPSGLKMSESAKNSGVYKYPVVDISVKAQKAGMKQAGYPESEVQCKGQKCSKFTVNSPEGSGYIVFDASGKVHEFHIEGISIFYEYDDYTVTIPEAEIVTVPSIPNMGGMDMGGFDPGSIDFSQIPNF